MKVILCLSFYICKKIALKYSLIYISFNIAQLQARNLY